jgi:hypothetical protein
MTESIKWVIFSGVLLVMLIEIIISLVFEGSVEVLKIKNLPTWVRILCAAIVGLMFLLVVGIIGFLAVAMWNQYYNIPSALFLIISFVFIVLAVKKIKSRF